MKWYSCFEWLSHGVRIKELGSGGGASGRAMAFCPSELGSNPGMDLAFFGNAINLFSLGVGQFLKERVIK